MYETDAVAEPSGKPQVRDPHEGTPNTPDHTDLAVYVYDPECISTTRDYTRSRPFFSFIYTLEYTQSYHDLYINIPIYIGCHAFDYTLIVRSFYT